MPAADHSISDELAESRHISLSRCSPEMQRQQLEQYVEGYRQNNSATAPTDPANILQVMQSLIERKLELFPEDNRQIVSTQVIMVGAISYKAR